MTIRMCACLAIAVVMTGAACTVSQTKDPGLTAPATYATSLSITASPDLLTLGSSFFAPGQSSQIVVKAFDEAGQPKPNQVVRLDQVVNNIFEDCGTLQARMLTTDRTGQAFTTFTAPGSPVPLPSCTSFIPGNTVTIVATPVGTNAQVSTGNFTSTDVRMVSPTFISPVGGLIVNFTITPNSAKVGASLTFSDSGSVSPGHTITSYVWDFGDGVVKTGQSVTHDYGTPGSYSVTLTITDDIQQSASKSANLTILP